MFIANPLMVSITIYKGQIVAEVATKSQVDIARLSILEGSDLGIETLVAYKLKIHANQRCIFNVTFARGLRS